MKVSIWYGMYLGLKWKYQYDIGMYLGLKRSINMIWYVPRIKWKYQYDMVCT